MCQRCRGNSCPECDGWKASHQPRCATCRIVVEQWKFTTQQLRWIGPEGNPARRNATIEFNAQPARRHDEIKGELHV